MSDTREPLVVDGIVLDKNIVEVLKNDIRCLRDAALEQKEMDYALSLSLVYAALDHYKETISI